MTPEGLAKVTGALAKYAKPADCIAMETGLPVEQAYHCLVWLYDRGAARMQRKNSSGYNAVEGWVIGEAA